MSKKIKFITLAVAFMLASSFFGAQAKASTNYNGKLVKIDGLSAVYYVATDGNRYVFPNSKIFFSWFTDFDDVITITLEELGNIPLKSNILYRPGVVLIKTVTDSNVYAVSKNGKLRSVKSEANAKALYGDDWNKLIDDVIDSFFTNYTIGEPIDSPSDFDPESEMNEAKTIESNFGLSGGNGNGLTARTRKCEFMNHVRHCGSTSNGNSNNTNSDTDDRETPSIDKITISNSGGAGYISTGDKISIAFSEAIDPKSIHSDLEADNYINSLEFGITGAISVFYDGVFEIKNIASFDLGKVDEPGEFSVKFELSSNAKTLYITLLSGNEIKIIDEDFEAAKQLSGIVKDLAGNAMESDPNIGKPSGSFGGININDGIEPYISSIRVYNNGNDDYIDVNDQIKITFSEAIDPRSIHSALDEGETVENVESNNTGGINISSGGILTVTNITSFSVGDVNDDGDFEVSLALNTAGTVLTITLTNGTALLLENEDLDDARQIGDTVEDKDDNEMNDDPNITDPIGTFIDESSGSDLYIDFIKAYDKGYAGYIDENDELVITFSEAIDPLSIDIGATLESGETGGVRINSAGLLTVTDILSFDIGDVKESGGFETILSLSDNKKVLTVSFKNGDPIKINSESFTSATQIGGYIINGEDNSIVMNTKNNIDNPTGTFGGDASESSPYIIQIDVINGNNADKIDVNDKIVITFNEAINPNSIDNDLELDDYIDGVDDNDTGGVSVNDNGLLTITDISKFLIGNVDDDSQFEVRLALNEVGNILTITLKSGTEVGITYEDLDGAEQIAGVIEDEDGNKMEEDPRIDDPTGSF